MRDSVGALAHLPAHRTDAVPGRITAPSTDRIERLMAVMGEPQRAAPAIHITGTNC